MRLIAADIGGTNARFALVDGLRILHSRTYPSEDYDSVLPVLDNFIQELKGLGLIREDGASETPFKAVSIAAAGTVSSDAGGERITGVNLSWTITSEEVKEAAGVSRCVLLNDFEAAAWGLFTIGPEDMVKVSGPEPDQAGTKALLGAGTGLGEALAAYCLDTGGWTVIRSEGGHCSFAPQDDLEQDLLAHLRARYGHVSYERLVSGMGLLRIHGFLSSKRGGQMDRSSPVPTHPRQVMDMAREGDGLAQEAVSLFFRIFAHEAGNLALKSLPKGGVYLAGGIIAKNLDLVSFHEVSRAFVSKGRMSGLLGQFPLYAVTTDSLGLLGAAYRAEQLLEGGPGRKPVQEG